MKLQRVTELHDTGRHRDTRRAHRREDVLKEKDRRINRLKADLDMANELGQRMREHVQDCEDIMEAWREAFDMELTDNGWALGNLVTESDGWHDKYVALLRKRNRFVPEYNAVLRPPRNVGRPLAASDAQRDSVLKFRKRGLALRAIAEETSLGVNTVRTLSASAILVLTGSYKGCSGIRNYSLAVISREGRNGRTGISRGSGGCPSFRELVGVPYGPSVLGWHPVVDTSESGGTHSVTTALATPVPPNPETDS